jgi:hypothetical protein
MSALNTVLFMPVYGIIFNHLSNVLQTDGSFNWDTFEQNGGLAELIRIFVAIVFFTLPVFLFTLLCFSPDPKDNKMLISRVSTRPEIMDLFGRLLVVANAVAFKSFPIVRAILHFVLVSLLLSMHIIYPSFVNVAMNYLHVFVLGSVTWVSAVALYGTQATNPDLCLLIAIGGIPFLGCIFAATIRFRYQYLDVIDFLERNMSEHLNIDNPDQLLAVLNNEVSKFVRIRCVFPMDIEIASRVCGDPEDTIIGRILFDKGMKKFRKSSYLVCQYTIFLVYVAKPASPEELDEYNNSSYKPFIDSTASGVFDSKDFETGRGTSHLREMRESQSSDLDMAGGNKLVEKSSKTPTPAHIFSEAQREKMISSMLRTAKSKRFALDLSYVIFYLETEDNQEVAATQAGEPKLSLLDSFKFRYDMKRATHHHKRALKLSHVFWMRLFTDDSLPSVKSESRVRHLNPVDSSILWGFADICDMLYDHCKQSEAHYLKLLERFPCSHLVAERYSDLLKSLRNDSKTGTVLVKNVGVAQNAKTRKHDSILTMSQTQSEESMESTPSAKKNVYGAMISAMNVVKSEKQAPKLIVSKNALLQSSCTHNGLI